MLPERFWVFEGKCYLQKQKTNNKKFNCSEKSGTATKVKLASKIMKQNQFYFATLVLVSYCLCGDNA